MQDGQILIWPHVKSHLKKEWIVIIYIYMGFTWGQVNPLCFTAPKKHKIPQIMLRFCYSDIWFMLISRSLVRISEQQWVKTETNFSCRHATILNVFIKQLKDGLVLYIILKTVIDKLWYISGYITAPKHIIFLEQHGPGCFIPYVTNR